MQDPKINSIADSLELLPESLAEGRILAKSVKEDEVSWRFSGIASDEGQDIEGDVILKKSIDLSYAKERGFVNWNHSRSPEDQLGYLTKASLVDEELRKSLADQFGFDPGPTASVYIEGTLYKHVTRSKSVFEILKSTEPTSDFVGLGLSLDGVVARDIESGGVVKAYVRGVAITPAPVHTRTLCALLKSLKGYSGREEEQLIKSLAGAGGFSEEEATQWLLRQRPNWTYRFAQQVVKYTINRKKE